MLGTRSCLVAVAFLVLFGPPFASAQLPTVINAWESRVDLPEPQPPNPIVVANDKQLFVDDWLIEASSGLERTWHLVKKHSANPLLRPVESWERPCVLLYGSVMYDPVRIHDRFRMWYLCFTPTYSDDFSAKQKTGGRIAYATSHDGIQWERPKLGLHEFSGSKENNIVIPGPHGFRGVEYDPRDLDPQRRYKAQCRLSSHGHAAYFSPDGIHWSKPQRMNLDGYDRSSVHWNPIQKLWFASTKSWYRMEPGAADWRGRGYQESTDFTNWPTKSAFLAGTEPGGNEIVYGLEPFYYESLFLASWGRYREEPDGLLDIQLATSRNARHWKRPTTQAWVPLTPLPTDFVREKKANSPHTGIDPRDSRVPWDYGNNSVSALGPIRVGDELWIYYSGRTSDHRSSPQTGAIGLATQRLDGFASMDAGDNDGFLLTRPLKLVNNSLRLNVDASNGEVDVEIVGPDGKALPRFGRDRCHTIRTDSLRELVLWDGSSDISEVLGTVVQLRFYLKRARLYAFWTGVERNWSTPDTTTWAR